MADLRAIRSLGITVAALTLAIDQVLKWVVRVPLDLPDRGVIPFVSVFDLRWVENYGVSMGFLVAGSPLGRWLLVLLTLGITVGVAVWMWREHRRWDVAALGAVLGGALGNVLDRTRFGYVVDYAHLHFGDWAPFNVFNLADAAISIGVVTLVLRALFVREGKPSSEDIHA